MQNPANLAVTSEATTLALLTYRTTARFPDSERFGLTAQMRRAAVSVGSNIAEGCGRRGNLALVSFLRVALGSVSELKYQAALATELALGHADECTALALQADRVGRMLSRLIVALRHRSDYAPIGRTS
jgi:four helix bundle protein